MKRLLFALCLLLGTQILSAQIISSQSVTVRKVEKPKKVRTHYDIEKGYRGFVEGAYSMHIGYPLGIHHSFDILTTHGYQCNHWLYLGGGAGLIGTGEGITYEETPYTYNEEYNNYNMGYSSYEYSPTISLSIPIYANARIYCLRTQFKPFVDVKIGGIIPLSFKDHYYSIGIYQGGPDDGMQTYHNREVRYGGFYGQFGVGVEYKRYALSFNYNLRSYVDRYHCNCYDECYWRTSSKNNTDTDSWMNPGIMTFNFGVNF